MKKLISITFLFFFCSLSQAQITLLGEVGANVSGARIAEGTQGTTNKLGLSLSAIPTWTISDRFKVHAALRYSQEGYKYLCPDDDCAKINYAYLRAGPQVAYSVSKTTDFYTGLSFGYPLEKVFNKSDLGLELGVRFNLDRFKLTLKYYQGIRNISIVTDTNNSVTYTDGVNTYVLTYTNDSSIYNNHIQVGLAYEFFKK